MSDVVRRGKTMVVVGLLAAVTTGLSQAWAFDLEGNKSRATLAELNAKRLPDSNATLARLDEMIEIGTVGMREYAAHEPAKLMLAAIGDSRSMKEMTDAQLEEKWGEKGYGGDAVGIALKSVEESGGPRTDRLAAEQYIYIKRWQTMKKARLLEQARDEAVELIKRLNSFPEQ